MSSETIKKPMIKTVILQYPSKYHEYPIDLIRNNYPNLSMKISNTIELPILCEMSQNPKKGSTLTVHYKAKETILELFAFENYIKGFIGHQTVRDIEYLAQVIAQECHLALNTEVTVEANIIYAGLSQQERIEVTV